MAEKNVENCDHECSSCSSSCTDRDPKSLIEKLHEGSKVKRVIGVVSGKGGVGKSLVTSLSAVIAQRSGYKTAIMDADITGPSIPKMFGIKENAVGDEKGIYPCKTHTGLKVMSLNLLTENETDPVVWRGPILAGTVKQFWTDVIWEDIDFMFVDMPPGTGDVPLTVFQSLPVDGIIVVASPQELVGMIVEKALNMATMMDIPVLGLVENMSYIKCPNCDTEIKLFGESHIDKVAEEKGLEILGIIPIEPTLALLCDTGSIEAFSGDWLNKIKDLLKEMEKTEGKL